MTSPLSSAEALDESVPGELVASSKGRPWKDVLAQVFIRRPVQESLIIPAVPEPLIVWVVAGAARVEERELGGEWLANEVRQGDFFLTASPRFASAPPRSSAQPGRTSLAAARVRGLSG